MNSSFETSRLVSPVSDKVIPSSIVDFPPPLGPTNTVRPLPLEPLGKAKFNVCFLENPR